MTKFAMVAVSLVSMAGVAAAGPGSGAGSAAAGAGAMMKPPAEIALMARSLAGTWRCKGQALGHDMKTMVDMTGTMKAGRLEAQNWWIHDVFDAAMGKEKFHFDSYVTFDTTSNKWHRVMIETGGAYATGESNGLTGGKLDWDLAYHSMMGEATFRDHLDASDPKAGIKAWGEASMDKGKTWTKIYEQTCKK